MTSADDAEWRRRSELTHLLQTCRRHGRVTGASRRGPLRQKDVADFAGLSMRHYAAFERAQIAAPSPSMVDAVAAALQMREPERSALHVLATGQDPPMPSPAGRTDTGRHPTIGSALRELVARQDPNPAALTDEMWTVLVANPALDAWSEGWFEHHPGERNLVIWLFSEQAALLLPGVHERRRVMAASLRYRYARNIASPQFAALVRTLLSTGPEAQQLWERHEVQFPRTLDRFEVRHAQHGIVEAHEITLPVSPQLWLTVTMYPWDTSAPDSSRYLAQAEKPQQAV